MAEERLRVILEMITGQYKTEARQAAQATGEINRSAKDTGTTLKGSAQQANAFGASLKGVFAGAAIGGAITALKGTVDAASDLGESLNAVQVVFGPYAAGIEEIGQRSAESFGLSQAAFNQFAVRFSAFAENIAGPGGDVVGVVEDITQRVADFASVHNLEVPEAAQVLQSALAGETEAFRRFGGDVSAAAVQTKAFELGLGTTSAELSEQDKILARYHLIMEQTSDTAGDFANTSDDLANRQRILAADIENTKASIGEALVPALEDALAAAEPLVDVAKLLADSWGAFTENNQRLKESGNPLEQIIAVLVEQSTQGALATLGQLIGLFGDNAEEAIEPTRRFSEGLSQLPAYAQDSTEAVDDLTGAIEENTEAMYAAADPVFAAVDALGDYQETLAKVREDGQITAEETLELAEAALGVGAAFNELDPATVTEAIGLLSEVMNTSQEDVRGLLEELGIFVDESGNIATGIQDGLIVGLDGLGVRMSAKLTAEATVAIRNFKDSLGIGSPSRVFADEIGQPISEGVAEGILEGMKEAKSAVQELVEEIQSQAEESLGSALDSISAMVSKRGARRGIDEAREELEELRSLGVVVGKDEEGREIRRKATRDEIADAEDAVIQAELRLIQSQIRLVEIAKQIGDPTKDRTFFDQLWALSKGAGLDATGFWQLFNQFTEAARIGGSFPALPLPGLQHGGHTQPGLMRRVGEGNMPELYLIPGEAGRVMPSTEVRALVSAMSGSGGVRYGDIIVSGQTRNLDESIRLAGTYAGIQRRIESRRR